MNMPGFVAEVSLYRSTGYYLGALTTIQGLANRQEVMPQIVTSRPVGNLPLVRSCSEEPFELGCPDGFISCGITCRSETQYGSERTVSEHICCPEGSACDWHCDRFCRPDGRGCEPFMTMAQLSEQKLA